MISIIYHDIRIVLTYCNFVSAIVTSFFYLFFLLFSDHLSFMFHISLFAIFVVLFLLYVFFIFFFSKQKTAYEMRISDWSSDVCSSDLDVADLYNRCSDYFLLQDGAAPTLDDARELFSDVPPEKSAHNQAVLGWKGPGGLYAIAAILRDYPRDGTWYLGFMIVDAAQR